MNQEKAFCTWMVERMERATAETSFRNGSPPPFFKEAKTAVVVSSLLEVAANPSVILHLLFIIFRLWHCGPVEGNI